MCLHSNIRVGAFLGVYIYYYITCYYGGKVHNYVHVRAFHLKRPYGGGFICVCKYPLQGLCYVL